jgi:LytS/YehU family sensor histidine kinase
MFLAYFVILAALPIAASTRTAALVAAVAAAEYTALVSAFIATGRLPIVLSPVAASSRPSVSPLDEGAKILLLLIAGAVATYATHWQEELARAFSRATEEREQLGARLERAQLQALKLQLHPHFLFNALNTITALVHANPDAAERMVSELSELLRASLSNASEQELPLSRELDVLGHYLEIQRIRFQDRLTVTLDIDPAARSALVPNLLLQPLVENAIRHGITPRAAPGKVWIAVVRQDATLAIDVEDDGVGENPSRPHRDGVGLGNTRARLRALYGPAHRFEAGSRPEGGFAVRMAIPFRLEQSDSDADNEGEMPLVQGGSAR